MVFLNYTSEWALVTEKQTHTQREGKRGFISGLNDFVKAIFQLYCNNHLHTHTEIEREKERNGNFEWLLSSLTELVCSQGLVVASRLAERESKRLSQFSILQKAFENTRYHIIRIIMATYTRGARSGVIHVVIYLLSRIIVCPAVPIIEPCLCWTHHI